MSVGHIARIFELAGIPTVSFGIQAFRNRMIPMSIPRLVLTPELLSKTLGKPNDASTQRRYLEIGLNLLVDASQGNTWVQVRR